MDAADRAAELLTFWRDAGPPRWFSKDDAFDAEFGRRFHDLHIAAARRALDGWLAGAEPALALLLLLDQYPRNSFRGTAHALATDPLARMLAHRAIDAGHDQQVGAELRIFFYLPFEHSEDMADQELSVRLHMPLGEQAARYALQHRDIIRRFGRFPHRNPLLGRASTPDEEAYLREGGFAG